MRMKINPGEAFCSRPTLKAPVTLGQIASFSIKAAYNAYPLKMLLLTLNGLTVKRTDQYHSCGVSHG